MTSTTVQKIETTTARAVLGVPCPDWCALDSHEVEQLPDGDTGRRPVGACEPGSVAWSHEDAEGAFLLIRYDSISQDGQQRTVGETYVRIGDDDYFTLSEARSIASRILTAVELASLVEQPEVAGVRDAAQGV